MFDKFIDLLITVWNDFKPLIYVRGFEAGVLYRAGPYKKNLYPGIHPRIPFIDAYHIESVAEDKITIDEVNLTTVDNKTISVGGIVEFKITDVHKAFVLTHDWRYNFGEICRGIMADYLEDCTWEDIKLKKTKNAILREIKRKAEEMGIEVYSFMFTDKSLSRVYKIVNSKLKGDM